ncbi:MAG: hypothetical protein O3A55_00170 [Bacteroidetes bacterium]|nr:hypothetical protein [Bacteroidota bacterium]
MRFIVIIFFLLLPDIFLSQSNLNYTLKNITISGNKILDSQKANELILVKQNDKINQNEVERGIENILNWYDENGFPYAEIEIENLEIDSSKKLINLSLKIIEGNVTTINNILIRGNKTTSNKIILREAENILHQTYKLSEVQKYKKRIERIGLFKSVSEPELKLQDSNTVLFLQVEELNYNTFNGIAGYTPTSDNKGTLTGIMKIYFRNIAGTGRKLFIDWEKENVNSHNYLLKYTEPWFLNYNFDLNIGLRQKKFEEIFTLFSYDLTGNYNLTENVSLGISYFNSQTNPQEIQKSNIPFSTESLIGGIISFDSRDNIRNFKNGSYLTTSILNGNKKNKINDSSSTVKISKTNLRFENVYPTSTENGFYNLFSFNSVNGSELEISDQTPLGGTTTLRGYRENEFYATTTTFLQSEFRYYTGITSQLYGFFDLGMFWNQNLRNKLISSKKEKELLFGYGAGVRLQTGDWLISFTIGFGKEDSFSEGKIHIGFQNEF